MHLIGQKSPKSYKFFLDANMGSLVEMDKRTQGAIADLGLVGHKVYMVPG